MRGGVLNRGFMVDNVTSLDLFLWRQVNRGLKLLAPWTKLFDYKKCHEEPCMTLNCVN